MVTLIISAAVGVLLFAALIRWWMHLDSSSSDALMLRKLRRAGSNLAEEHDVHFYLGFHEAPAARHVAQRLKQEGFELELLDADEEQPWVVVVRQSLVPKERHLKVIRDRLRAEAEANGGEYGGWDARPVPSPRIAGLKVSAVLVTLILLGHAIAFTDHEGWLTAWFVGFIFLGIPLLILTAGDLAYACRTAPSRSPMLSAAAFILGVPQALFALLTVAIGLAIIVWVLYNTFIERQPQYSGGFLTFGVAPVMLVVGIAWLKRTLVRREQPAARPEKKNA